MMTSRSDREEEHSHHGAIPWEMIALWFGRGLLLVALWMGQQLLAKVDDMAKHLEAQQDAMTKLTSEMAQRTALRWTQVDQRLWATVLAQRNPSIIVPDPIHVDLPGEPPK